MYFRCQSCRANLINTGFSPTFIHKFYKMNMSIFRGCLIISSLILVVVFIPFSNISGQSTKDEAKKLQRPEDCGINKYDDYKNAAFDLLADILKTDLNYEKIKADTSNQPSGEKDTTLNISGANADLTKLKTILKSIKAMDDRLQALTSDSNDLLKNVVDIKPASAARQASYITNTSRNAVDLSGKLIKEITDSLTKDIEFLAKKITDRGGKVDEEPAGNNFEKPK